MHKKASHIFVEVVPILSITCITRIA
jgi:hypothetical protein